MRIGDSYMIFYAFNHPSLCLTSILLSLSFLIVMHLQIGLHNLCLWKSYHLDKFLNLNYLSE